MNTKRVALLVLLPVVAGWVGYYVGAMRETRIIHMPRGATAALDHLVSAESFSEVEQTRAVLEALAARYVENAQGLIAQGVITSHSRYCRTAVVLEVALQPMPRQGGEHASLLPIR